MAHPKHYKRYPTIPRLLQLLSKLHPRLCQDHQSNMESYTKGKILELVNDTDSYKIECDTSNYATGAVLSQKQNREWRPITFFSKALTATEWNYKIHDRELLAIIRILEEWWHYFQGNANKIKVITDHKNLEYFLIAKKLNWRKA